MAKTSGQTGKGKQAKLSGPSKLKRGDTVMVISGGNKKVRPIKGQTGKIVRFVDEGRRAVVEGLNLVTRHQKAKGPGKTAGKVRMESPIQVSRLMFFAEKIKRPVRLSVNFLADGTRVRGYKNPETGKFEQI
jgi:large subunit ribosomal protein L24